MKTRTKNLFLPPALIAGLGLMLAGRAAAQSCTTLHSFTGDTAGPLAGLVLSGNTLYGTTRGYAPDLSLSDYGTVFAVNTDGTGFTNLHSFVRPSCDGTNSDGAAP